MTEAPHSRSCPVCHRAAADAPVFLERNIHPDKLSGFSFASRKTPEFMCHRLVRCQGCGLVYADQPPGREELHQAYHQAEFDSQQEANDAAAAYIRAISPALAALPQRRSALEIGTGTGVFLEHLQRAGFSELVGVEPSTAAIAAAPAHRRTWIREGMFEERDFAPGSFDLVCCFMTLEHVPDPLEIAAAAQRLLRPGGAFAAVVHDYEGVVNRLLGRRSPIIDIEHLQLFSRSSATRLFAEAGLTRFSAQSFVNTYELPYWIRLAPLPGALKRAALGTASTLGLGHLRLSVNVGNLIVTGFRDA